MIAPQYPSALTNEYTSVLARLDALSAIVEEHEQRKRLLKTLLDDTRVAEALADPPVEAPSDAAAPSVEPSHWDLRIADLVLPAQSVVIRFAGGDGSWAELTTEQAMRLHDALDLYVGSGNVHDLPHDSSDLTLEECVRRREHGGTVEPDGTCTFCGTPFQEPTS